MPSEDRIELGDALAVAGEQEPGRRHRIDERVQPSASTARRSEPALTTQQMLVLAVSTRPATADEVAAFELQE